MLSLLFKISEKINSIGKWAEEKANLQETEIMEPLKGFISLITGLASIYVIFISFLGVIEWYRGDYALYNTIKYGAICIDGWQSRSIGQGTCSHHGGVDYYLEKKVEVGYHYANPGKYFFQILGYFGLLAFFSLFSKWFMYLSIAYLSFLAWIPFVPFALVVIMTYIVTEIPFKFLRAKILNK